MGWSGQTLRIGRCTQMGIQSEVYTCVWCVCVSSALCTVTGSCVSGLNVQNSRCFPSLQGRAWTRTPHAHTHTWPATGHT